MQEVDNYNKKVKPIVFVNNPIKSNDSDVIGFSSQVETISDAIDNGEATMIGVIADYGTGKSSMTEMLKNRYVDLGYPTPIKVNMWDSLSDSTNQATNESVSKSANQVSNESVSNLTKSFLFQLANGHNRRLGSYVNKLLSKNYGTISFASNHYIKLFICFIIAALCFAFYKISAISGTGIMQYLPDWCAVLASYYKLLSPLCLLASCIFAVIGIKDICIAFSHWKMTNNKTPEINDVFDIYRIIADEIKPPKNKKQLVFVDDLDRIENKKIVISFLKELYRFQDSICEEKSKFVFIVSVMPESNLLKDEKETSNVFSKIFDTTIYLKPIHFDDYDSILIQLIKGNTDKKERLEELIGEKIEDHLPDAFKWIKRGSNLTLRDLKERLNQAIAIMVSLINKSYVGNSAADFQACTAVAYLESKFPDDYYNLIQSEVQFAEFIKMSLPIINQLDETSNDKLVEVFNEIFKDAGFSTEFISELCLLISNEIIDDDFRMYFYTYPQGSHIKTTSEREICDFLLYPNQRINYSGLSNAVEQAFKNGNNPTVEEEIRARSSFPRVLLENNTLFVKSAMISIEKLFLTFKKFCLDEIDFEDNDIDIWKRVLLLNDTQRKNFINKLCSTLLETNTNDSILQFRRKMILAFGDEIINCSDIFINDDVPVISSEEIDVINNQLISIQLINTQKLSIETYPYICQLILSSSLIDKDKEVFNKALNIFGTFSTVIKDEVSNDTLKFLQQNHYLDNKAFEFIYPNIDDDLLVNYINEFIPTALSDTYLSCLNQKCLSNGLSDDLLDIMIAKDYLITPLSHYSNQDKLGQIDILESHKEQVLSACETINAKYPNIIVSIRFEAYLVRGISEYLDLYLSPYPLMTKDEYVNESNAEKAISLIDVSRIDDNDFEQAKIIHMRSYNQDELILLFLNLFDTQNYEGVSDDDIKTELVNSLVFAELGFKQLSFDQRNEIYSLISDVLTCDNSEAIIEFLKSVDCFIPFLEEKIKDEEGYTILIKEFDEFSSVTVEWLNNNYINCGLSEKLCNKLYESGDYINYIIASALRTGTLLIDDNIPFDDYLEVYKNSNDVFDIMSNHFEFLELFQTHADFTKFDIDHIVPAYKTKQHERFFKYIDSLSPEEKKSYYKTFGKLASLNDSKAFRKLVCREENMELLGDYDIYYHIKEQLWEDDPYDKGQFTKCWNKHWKAELDEKHLIETD